MVVSAVVYNSYGADGHASANLADDMDDYAEEKTAEFDCKQR